MTYSPAQAGIQTGEDYFTSIGLIGGSTGMEPILSMPTVLSAPDGYRDGTTVTTTDSVVKQTPGADCWLNWNFLDSGTTSYSKVLCIGYGIADYFGLTVSENAYTGAQTAIYYLDVYQWRSDGRLYSNNGTSWVNFATDATYTPNNNLVTNPIIGLAMYLETDQVQKTFIKTGSGSWVQILSTTDSANGSAGYKSVGCYDYATTKRVVAPVMAWGVV